MSGILNSIYNNSTYAFKRHADALFKLQEQTATGARINRPSDDPSTAYRILSLDNERSSLENYISTINDMSSSLETGTSVLQTMASVISEARVTITQVTSGVYDQQSRDRTAEAINDAIEQLVQLANTKYNGQYLFGGADTSSAPYAVQRTNGEITAVTYQGSSEKRSVDVAPGVTASGFYVGDELFNSDQPRRAGVFMGTTGAAPGTGTPSVTGDVWLTVTFDGTNYKISIDDGATTVDVPSGGSPNQQVTDSRTGKVLYVDTTGINGTGTELVRVPGTYNVFDTLITIRDILRNSRDLTDAEVQKYRNASIDSLEEVRNLLTQKQVSIGSKVGFLDDLKSSLESIKNNNEDESGQLQQADIAQVAIDLARQQALYQMSLSVAGKLLSLSLLDFIQ